MAATLGGRGNARAVQMNQWANDERTSPKWNETYQNSQDEDEEKGRCG
jgi:hypothetical protein